MLTVVGHKRKNAGFFTVTRPTLRGSDNAQYSQNEQPEAHACMYINTSLEHNQSFPYKVGDYTPMDIYRCQVL